MFVHGIKDERPLVLMLKQGDLGQALRDVVQEKCPKLPSSFILLHQGRKVLTLLVDLPEPFYPDFPPIPVFLERHFLNYFSIDCTNDESQCILTKTLKTWRYPVLSSTNNYYLAPLVKIGHTAPFYPQ